MNICYNCFNEHSGSVCPGCGYNVSQDKGKYPVALPKGTILAGRYIVGRVLGQGGFGITYVAQNYQTKEICAVKEYFPETLATRIESRTVSTYSDDRADSFNYGKECFLNEAKTLAEFIGNPNIVRVYSYFEENNTAYFVMEYIKGISLQTYLKNNGGKISVAAAKNILFPIMDAMSDVHSKGIIHRDISPDNIYITEDGSIKLLDFGAARYSLGDKSRSLDVVLKHGYAPKEQYTRRGRQGPYTDIYSLSATFYRSITGKIPPDSVERMDEDDLIYPGNLGISISKTDEDALVKALSVYPADRFQNMLEFKNAFTSANVMPTISEYTPRAGYYNSAVQAQNRQEQLRQSQQEEKQERLEKERLEQERAERERSENERQERERKEQERKEEERRERERKEQEKKKQQEAKRIEREKKQKEEQERLRLAKEEKEKKKQLEAERKKLEKEQRKNELQKSDANTTAKKRINPKVLMIAAIALAAVIIVTAGVTVAVVVSGNQEGENTSYNSFSYSVNDNNGITITGYTGEEKDVVVPESIDGMTVTEIGTKAFYESDITSISIGEGVTAIDKWAFYGSKNLASVTIPDTVTSIEYYAFLACDSLKNIEISEDCSYSENSFDSTLVITTY